MLKNGNSIAKRLVIIFLAYSVGLALASCTVSFHAGTKSVSNHRASQGYARDEPISICHSLALIQAARISDAFIYGDNALYQPQPGTRPPNMGGRPCRATMISWSPQERYFMTHQEVKKFDWPFSHPRHNALTRYDVTYDGDPCSNIPTLNFYVADLRPQIRQPKDNPVLSNFFSYQSEHWQKPIDKYLRVRKALCDETTEYREVPLQVRVNILIRDITAVAMEAKGIEFRHVQHGLFRQVYTGLFRPYANSDVEAWDDNFAIERAEILTHENAYQRKIASKNYVKPEVPRFLLIPKTSSAPNPEPLPGGQSDIGPTQSEMVNAMTDFWRNHGQRLGQRLGFDIKRTKKSRCISISKNEFRCSYQTWISADCNVNPVACLTALTANGAYGMGVFKKQGSMWSFGGAEKTQ